MWLADIFAIFVYLLCVYAHRICKVSKDAELGYKWDMCHTWKQACVYLFISKFHRIVLNELFYIFLMHNAKNNLEFISTELK